MSDDDSGYKGSSSSWFRTVKQSQDARQKVKDLASAIASGKQQPKTKEETEPAESDSAEAPKL